MARARRIIRALGALAALLAAPATRADLFVTSTNTNQVVRYDAFTGASLGVFAQGGGLNGPIDLAFGFNGDLFVASDSTDAVRRYDGTTGADEGVFAQGGGLDGPGFLVFNRGTVVPEPSALALTAIGLLGLALARRPRRAAG